MSVFVWSNFFYSFKHSVKIRYVFKPGCKTNFGNGYICFCNHLACRFDSIFGLI